MRDNPVPHAIGRFAGRVRRSAIVFAASVVALSAGNAVAETSTNAPQVAALSGSPKTIGLALALIDYRYYETPDGKEECPEGSVATNRQNWEKQFPTNEERAQQLQRCGSTQNRGPNCENVWFAPAVMEDPLPFREVKGKMSYGFNLDGTTDGHATATTCAHEKFTSPDGETGVDNQFYRFVGCHKGIVEHAAEARTREQVLHASMRWLIEVTGVDNEQNDDNVEVSLYRGRDPLIIDSANKAVPWQTQQASRLEFRLKGRIVNGVLETDPADVEWDEHWQFESHAKIRGMKLRLRLTPDGADGYRTGYVDINQFWQTYSRSMSGLGNVLAASAPAAYRAMKRLADGYKDPQTGLCTALSSARRFEFVRAFIVHPADEPHRPQSSEQLAASGR